MKLMEGDKVFVLRYNDNFVKDSMEIHKAVCDKEGFCWYGKTGKRPNVEKMNNFVEGGRARILFYNRKAMFMGELIEVSLSAPKNGVPDYYTKLMWKPSFWFKVACLDEVYADYLGELIIDSTGKTMKETINSSMTSFYFTTAKESIRLS